MKVKIDIRGRINQWDTKSILGFASDEEPNFHHVVVLESKYKKQLRKKFGNLPNFPDKLHCILICYAIEGHLNKISVMQICNDINKKKIMKYLKDYLGNSQTYNKITKSVKSVGNAKIHKLLIRVGKGRHKPDLKLTPSKIMKYLC